MKRRSRGTVTQVNARGYGFILDEGQVSRFFHATAVGGDGFDQLQPGDVVSFEALETEKGPRAVKVRKGEGR